MTVLFRALLIAASIAATVYFLIKIRQSKARIEDVLFWLLFSLGIILLSVFPEVLSYFARILGVQSPVNFLYLVIIFLLIIRVFRLTLKVSMLECKLNRLGQAYALDTINKESTDNNP